MCCCQASWFRSCVDSYWFKRMIILVIDDDSSFIYCPNATLRCKTNSFWWPYEGSWTFTLSRFKNLLDNKNCQWRTITFFILMECMYINFMFTCCIWILPLHPSTMIGWRLNGDSWTTGWLSKYVSVTSLWSKSIDRFRSWPGGGGARRFFIVPVELKETIEDASEMIDDVRFLDFRIPTQVHNFTSYT